MTSDWKPIFKSFLALSIRDYGIKVEHKKIVYLGIGIGIGLGIGKILESASESESVCGIGRTLIYVLLVISVILRIFLSYLLYWSFLKDTSVISVIFVIS